MQFCRYRLSGSAQSTPAQSQKSKNADARRHPETVGFWFGSGCARRHVKSHSHRIAKRIAQFTTLQSCATGRLLPLFDSSDHFVALVAPLLKFGLALNASMSSSVCRTSSFLNHAPTVALFGIGRVFHGHACDSISSAAESCCARTPREIQHGPFVRAYSDHLPTAASSSLPELRRCAF